MVREYFDDCGIGEHAVTPARTVTESDVVWFAGLTGDWNPIHTDKELASRSEFGGRIAHGMLILALGTGLITRIPLGGFLPKSLIAVVGIDRVRLVKPVMIGDTIHVECEMLEAKSMTGGKGLLEVRFRIINQAGETVQTGRWKCLAGRRSE
ncbi:MAG: MaoC/PaaZ C-terminal domain-containing protein [Desulfobacteraceae bacterium]